MLKWARRPVGHRCFLNGPTCGLNIAEPNRGLVKVIGLHLNLNMAAE